MDKRARNQTDGSSAKTPASRKSTLSQNASRKTKGAGPALAEHSKDASKPDRARPKQR